MAGTRPPEDSSLRRRLFNFLPVALIPNAVVVAGVVLFALCALMLTDSGFVPLAATVAQLWLAVNLAPVASDSAVLSQLPMLPALGVVWLVAHRVRVAVRDRISILDLAVLTGCVLIVPALLALTAAVMLLDARSVLPVEVPPLATVFGRVLLLHLTALAIGMGPKLWRALARRFSVPAAVVDPVAPAVRFVLSLGAAGLVLALVSLAAHWRVLGELLSSFDGGPAAAGLLGLSLLYLPDAAVAGAAVLVGSEFHIGDASVSLYDATVVPLPPLPILAAFPGSVGGWALALIIVPLALAGAVSHAHCRTTPRAWSEIIAAGVWAGAFALIAGWLSGGTVGVYGSSGMMVLFTAALVAVELAAVGAVVNAVVGLRQRRARRTTTDGVDDGTGSVDSGAPVAEPADGDGDTGAADPVEFVDEEDLIAAGGEEPDGEEPDGETETGGSPTAGERSPDAEGTGAADPADPGERGGVAEKDRDEKGTRGSADTEPGPAETDGGPGDSAGSPGSEVGEAVEDPSDGGYPETAVTGEVGSDPEHGTRPLP
ncbi:cell division protein PerM [Corynebacterium antarcticum]|uniref:cell division protein PerM n=1 Tax=Corynebacterium antarcticum TaxID=2800405 RepID=UPI002260FD24|nr:DUF6350 family protein [Corynebacterium antarcticum]MCX7540591.1 DUF6350 family protein [Corynebacterium antarcticum]